jgi:hypothetical protein
MGEDVAVTFDSTGLATGQADGGPAVESHDPETQRAAVMVHSRR